MNQIFSLTRWLQLVRRHWMENSKLFLYGTLSLIGAIGITLFLWLLSDSHYTQYEILIFYLLGLFIVGAIFASGSFDMLQKKDRGIYYLSLPASHFEKLLTQIFYNVFFFTIIYSLCFYVMQEMVTLIIENKVAADPRKYSFDRIDWENPYGIAEGLKYFVIIFFAVQALFLLGSVYFKRFSFLLTTIVLVIFIFFIGYYLNFLRDRFLSSYYWNESTLHPVGPSNKVYKLPTTLTFFLKWFVLLAWAPILWLTAWFRLREKQI